MPRSAFRTTNQAPKKEHLMKSGIASQGLFRTITLCLFSRCPIGMAITLSETLKQIDMIGSLETMSLGRPSESQ
jgi:hypothetical protein